MRYLVILLFSIISVSSFSQTTTPINLDWTESLIVYPTGEKINTLTFTGASLNEENSWIPEYSHLQLTSSTNELFTVELFDTQFKLLSSTERQILRNKTISNTIKPSINTVVIRKQNYQQVKFTPIRKNPLTGQLEKLIRFSLRFQKKSQNKSLKQSKSYVASSVLQSGKWVKIAIDTTAVHKITYSQLIDMGISNPENIRIYGSGGGMLPKMNSEDSLDDLPNNSIYMDKGSDGIFNSGDFILFYAKGPRSWKFDEASNEFVHENHLYSDFSHYFLSSDMGSPTLIQSAASLSSSNINVTGFDDYAVFDQDDTNLLESGRLWLANTFDVTTNYSFNFSFPNLKRLISENTKFQRQPIPNEILAALLPMLPKVRDWQ